MNRTVGCLLNVMLQIGLYTHNLYFIFGVFSNAFNEWGFVWKINILPGEDIRITDFDVVV